MFSDRPGLDLRPVGAELRLLADARLVRDVEDDPRPGQHGQPHQLGVALVVADDDRARHAIDPEDRQVVAGRGPGLGELDLVVALDDLARGVDDRRRVVELVAVPVGRADDGVDARLPAGVGDPALGLGQPLGGGRLHHVLEVAGQGALGEDGDPDALPAEAADVGP